MIPSEYEQFEQVVTVGRRELHAGVGRPEADPRQDRGERRGGRLPGDRRRRVRRGGAHRADRMRRVPRRGDGMRVPSRARADGSRAGNRPRGRPRARVRPLRDLRTVRARCRRPEGALQLGGGDRSGRPARHVPQDPSRRAAVGHRGDRVPAREPASRVPHAVRPDRRADLLRLLVQPRAHAHPGAQGRGDWSSTVARRSRAKGSATTW